MLDPVVLVDAGRLGESYRRSLRRGPRSRPGALGVGHVACPRLRRAGEPPLTLRGDGVERSVNHVEEAFRGEGLLQQIAVLARHLVRHALG
jgi:hypothetical protein